MEFSIGGHCPTHGEIDMDDSLAYCEECYETIGKAELATLRAKVAELERAIREYESECTNPAPDYTMRRLRREQLFNAALAAAKGE